jgi:adenylate kinase
MLGPPGSGKGTVAHDLEKKKGWKHISTGDLLRAEVKKKTARGKALAGVMTTGKLVPDKTVTEILKDYMEHHKLKKFILDGFPRTRKQAELLDELLASKNQKIDAVVRLRCLNKVIFKRLTSRMICPKCRAVYGLDVPPKKEGVCDKCESQLAQREDEKPETVLKRIKVYASETKPLIDYYSKRNLVRGVNASLTLPAVLEQVYKVLS